MDAVLHCNAIKCRAQCVDRAVVTTCSHIFCLRCADELGLSSPKDGHRICPACSAQLDLADDACITSLNPSEDYKTSILSGFSPTVIMDCVSRGLDFWSYQMAQEINYQAYLSKTLTERYRTMSDKLDSKIRQADDQNQILNQRINEMSTNLDDVVNQNELLKDQLRNQHNELTKKTNIIQKLLHKNSVPGVELAAEQDAEQALKHAAAQPLHRDSNQQVDTHLARRQNSEGSGGGQGRRARMTLNNSSLEFTGAHGSRAGQGSRNSFPISLPGSANRTPLASANYRAYGKSTLANLGGQPFQQTTSNRASYQTGTAGMYGSGGSPAGGQGLSANVRVGRPPQRYGPQPTLYQNGRPSNMNIR